MEMIFRAIVLGAVGYAAFVDLSTRRIPDASVLVCFLAGACCSFSIQGWTAFLSISAAVCALAALMIFVHYGYLGGGDAKLMAAVTAGFPMPVLPLLAFSIAVGGGALAVVMIVFRRTRLFSTSASSERYQTVPYGVAIAIGTVIASFNSLPFDR